MDWIDKKEYDMVKESCLKMYKISNKVINFIEKTMKTWRVEVTAGGRRQAKAEILPRVKRLFIMNVCDQRSLQSII